MTLEQMNCTHDQAPDMNVFRMIAYGYGYRCGYGYDDEVYEIPDEYMDQTCISDLVWTCKPCSGKGQPSETLT